MADSDSQPLCWTSSAWREGSACFNTEVSDVPDFLTALHSGTRHVVVVDHLEADVPAPKDGAGSRAFFRILASTKSIRGSCGGAGNAWTARELGPTQCLVSAYAGYGLMFVLKAPASELWIDNLYISLHGVPPAGVAVPDADQHFATLMEAPGALWLTRLVMEGPGPGPGPGLQIASECIGNTGTLYMSGCTISGFYGADAVLSTLGALHVQNTNIEADNRPLSGLIITDAGSSSEIPSVTRLVNTTLQADTSVLPLLKRGPANESLVESDFPQTIKVQADPDDSAGLVDVELDELPDDLAAVLIDENDAWFRQMLQETGGWQPNAAEPGASDGGGLEAVRPPAASSAVPGQRSGLSQNMAIIVAAVLAIVLLLTVVGLTLSMQRVRRQVNARVVPTALKEPSDKRKKKPKSKRQVSSLEPVTERPGDGFESAGQVQHMGVTFDAPPEAVAPPDGHALAHSQRQPASGGAIGIDGSWSSRPAQPELNESPVADRESTLQGHVAPRSQDGSQRFRSAVPRRTVLDPSGAAGARTEHSTPHHSPHPSWLMTSQ